MKDYTLSREKITELEKFHRSLRDKRQADRVKAVIALSKGWSAAQVAEILLLESPLAMCFLVDKLGAGGLYRLNSVMYNDEKYEYYEKLFKYLRDFVRCLHFQFPDPGGH